MPAPTTGEFLNQTIPAASTGDQTVVVQSDGATPQQSITFVPKRATGSLFGTVKPDGTSIVIAGGVISAVAIVGNVGVRFDPILVGKTLIQPMAYAGTLTGGGLMFADVSGSAQITIKKCTPSTYPTFTSIVASAPVTLVSQQKNTSIPQTGWTLTFAKDDLLQFTLDSASTVAWVELVLDTVRS